MEAVVGLSCPKSHRGQDEPPQAPRRSYRFTRSRSSGRRSPHAYRNHEPLLGHGDGRDRTRQMSSKGERGTSHYKRIAQQDLPDLIIAAFQASPLGSWLPLGSAIERLWPGSRLSCRAASAGGYRSLCWAVARARGRAIGRCLGSVASVPVTSVASRGPARLNPSLQGQHVQSANRGGKPRPPTRPIAGDPAIAPPGVHHAERRQHILLP